ncbi:MAG: hypothetical protein AB8W37_12595 [Arsenophonus endosymbiont of Dermacentor nuttalli]
MSVLTVHCQSDQVCASYGRNLKILLQEDGMLRHQVIPLIKT